MVSLPPCNRPHIPGGLDPVAPGAEHLEISRIPLVPAHGDRPDVVQDKRMQRVPAFSGRGFRDLPPATRTLPLLLQEDQPPHLANRGPLFAPVYRTARGLAADGIRSVRKLRSLAAADRAGSPGEALLFFGAVGIPAAFAGGHFLYREVWAECDKAGDWRVKVMMPRLHPVIADGILSAGCKRGVCQKRPVQGSDCPFGGSYRHSFCKNRQGFDEKSLFFRRKR
jgi:hypothetical protein